MSKFTPFALSLALGALLAAPAFAGDAKAGEDVFKKCKSCHAITAPDGTEVVKGGKVGPNLYGVVGRQIGTAEGFKYGEGTIAAGADGTKWDEAMIAAYVVDPTKWIEEKTGDDKLKSKMTFKLAKGGEDVAAYLASVAPAQ
ncbi:c-type cytochrome [Stagnihabitans tardus]|uniref:Cytochrome C n=1 Tax=Stagnihabitans tardus TaxID=2699202 RepID=A0AAE5BT20_9RHOB|nr:c-type cytochrome [Stagnihabitans tardus]NBZ86136.1 cytochrome C [Stagnihabitans tardus]